jgi:hypothetical protein
MKSELRGIGASGWSSQTHRVSYLTLGSLDHAGYSGLRPHSSVESHGDCRAQVEERYE